MWQIGLSFNCNNPSLCNSEEFGGTGGFWGWAELDRSADGTQTSEFTNEDSGVSAVPGHYSTTDIFGFSAPGVAVQIQVAFRPAK